MWRALKMMVNFSSDFWDKNILRSSGGRCNRGERLLGMVMNLGLQTREDIPKSKTNRVYCDHPSWPSAKSLEKLLLWQPYSSHGSWSLLLQRPALFETSSNEELTKPLGKSQGRAASLHVPIWTLLWLQSWSMLPEKVASLLTFFFTFNSSSENQMHHDYGLAHALESMFKSSTHSWWPNYPSLPLKHP